MEVHKRLENVRVVKHSPPSSFKYSDTQKVFKLKSSSSFMATIKQITKKLSIIERQIVTSNSRNGGANVIKDRFLTVIGLQKVIPKLLQIAVYFQERNHEVEIRTKTVHALDEFKRVQNGGVETKQPTPGEFINENSSGDESDVDSQPNLRKRLVTGMEVKIYIKTGV